MEEETTDMKIYLWLTVLMIGGFANAANVVWSGGRIEYYAPGENWGYDSGVQIYNWWVIVGDGDISVNVFMDVQSTYSSADYSFLSKSDNDRFLVMSPGETINASTMAGAGMIGETMHVDLYNTVFVAYETLAYKDIYTPYKVYGWVEFGFDNPEGLIVVNGALDMDGGPMLVGGGAIPEPSSWVLLLLGFAGLALRRRGMKVA